MRGVPVDLAQKTGQFDSHAVERASGGPGGRGLHHTIAPGTERVSTHGPPASPDAAHPVGRRAGVESGGKPVESAAGWRSPLGPECLHTYQRAAARGTTWQRTGIRWIDGRSVVTCGIGFDGAGPEACSRPGEPMTVGGAAHAGIAHLDASGGQYVRQQPTQTRFSRQRTGVDLSGGRCRVLNGDVAFGQRQEAVVADGHPKAVRREIAQGLRPTAHRRTVNHPVLVPDLRIHERAQVGLVQRVSERGADEHGQGLDVDPNVWARGEPSVIGRESTSRHEVMHVRMVAQSAGPRMEPPDPADPAADDPGTQRQCLSGL